MSVIHLVRHGQASLGAEIYDELSDRGRRQAALVGRALSRRHAPDIVVSGDLRRHRQTVEHSGFGAGRVDPRWNEFDHEPILAAARIPVGAPTAEAVRSWQTAKERWSSGRYDAEYPEPYRAFAARARAALDDVAAELPRGGHAVVVTSAGVIAALLAATPPGFGGDWLRWQQIVVNTGVTKAVVGASGPTLVSFNDHAHLDPGDITYG